MNNSPAGKSGLRRGDIIIGFDSFSIVNIGDLQKQISKKRIGERVTIEIVRGYNRGKINLKIEGTS